ncbi:diguanylate cyclase domain-containing protein [Terrarubrum flagellatum]|uniref:diguanylate cyclase domain-containing protein n=1 Tax=Terrirubrum flagellatum TaxID=2895980 RepID=UPI00314555C9
MLDKLLRPFLARSLSLAVTAFLAAVCVLFVGHEAWRIFDNRAHALREARTDLLNLSRSIAQHAEDTVRTVDAVLINMVRQLENGAAKGEEPQRLELLVREQIVRLPPISNIVFIDRNGLLALSGSQAPNGMDLHDRDYFHYHQNDASRLLRINRPVRSRSTGRWVIPMTRRVDAPDGAFAGVVAAVVDMDYFQSFYDRFDIGERGAILLATASGDILVRRPFLEANIGRSVANGGIFKELLPNSLEGVGEIRSSTDGVVRINGYRKLDAYPLVLAIAEETDEILAPWRAATRVDIIRASALGAIIIALGLALGMRTRALAKRDSLLRATLDNMNQGLIVVDEKGTLPICNRRARELLDLPPSLIESRPTATDVINYQTERGEFDNVPPEVRQRVNPRTHGDTEHVYERVRPNGTMLEIRTIPFDKGGVVRTYTDITERNRFEQQLRRSEQEYRLLADNTSDIVARLNGEGRFEYVSPASRDILGYQPDELIGRHASDIVHAAERPLWLSGAVNAPARDAAVAQTIYRAVRKDGSAVWVEENRKWLSEIGEYVLSIRDISKRKHAELLLEAANRRLESIARLDGLTGVPNRRAFDEALATELRRASRSRTPVSLIMIDTDHFKAYNDFYGHLAGDECLKVTASMLKATLSRPGDFVARYGGEEFAIILPNTPAAGARELAERLGEAMRKLALPHEKSAFGVVTLSMGVASVSPTPGSDFRRQLISRADKALYAAKRDGRNRIAAAESEEQTARETPRIRAAGS